MSEDRFQTQDQWDDWVLEQFRKIQRLNEELAVQQAEYQLRLVERERWKGRQR